MNNEKESKSVPNNKVIHRLKYISIPAAILVISLTLIFSLFNPFSSSLTISAQDLMKGVTPAKVDSTTLSDDFVKSTADFSIDLFKQSLTKGKNSLVSPTSVLLALGMTANGADGMTLKEFEALLGKQNLTIDDLNRYYHSYAKKLTDVKTGKLNLANSIWYRQDETVNKSFLQVNANHYNASAYEADFSSPQTVKDINNWVSFNTGNLINKILDKIDPEAVMFLVNTLYFEGEWEEKYYTQQIYNQNFTIHDGKVVSVPFMSSIESGYLKADNAQGFIKPYKDNKFSFVALLPNKGISADSYAASLTAEKFLSLIENKSNESVCARIPKFRTEYTKELVEPLKAMGLKTCFDSGLANFSKMGTSQGGNLFIGNVLHKTFIQVDELGTKAGAVTKVEMEKGGGPGSDIIIKLDRPFVYAIIDNETSLPLFIGTMQNPQ